MNSKEIAGDVESYYRPWYKRYLDIDAPMNKEHYADLVNAKKKVFLDEDLSPLLFFGLDASSVTTNDVAAGKLLHLMAGVRLLYELNLDFSAMSPEYRASIVVVRRDLKDINKKWEKE